MHPFSFLLSVGILSSTTGTALLQNTFLTSHQKQTPSDVTCSDGSPPSCSNVDMITIEIRTTIDEQHGGDVTRGFDPTDFAAKQQAHFPKEKAVDILAAAVQFQSAQLAETGLPLNSDTFANMKTFCIGDVVKPGGIYKCTSAKYGGWEHFAPAKGETDPWWNTDEGKETKAEIFQKIVKKQPPITVDIGCYDSKNAIVDSLSRSLDTTTDLRTTQYNRDNDIGSTPSAQCDEIILTSTRGGIKNTDAWKMLNNSGSSKPTGGEWSLRCPVPVSADKRKCLTGFWFGTARALGHPSV